MRTRVLEAATLLALMAPGAARCQMPEGVSESYSLVEDQASNGSFCVQRMELGDALRLLLRDEGISLVLAPDVSGLVDMEIANASPSEILDLLAETHGFHYEFRGSVLFVEKQETREFALELIQTFDPELPGGDMRMEWSQVRESLEAMKSPTGKLSVHELSGLIVARDEPQILDEMERFLRGIRERLSRQVQIEARIIEVQLEKSMEAGVDWAALSGVLSGDFEGSLPVDGSVARQSTTTGDGVFKIGILKPGKVDLLVDLLAQRTNLRMIARPRVVSAANRSAMIEVTERVPYVTKDVSREGGVAFTDFDIEFEEAGVEMIVTAQPSPDGRISLAVHPTVSSVTGYTPSLPDLGPQPIVDIRETKTSVSVNNEETLVISGLIQERMVHETRGIPLLQDIPLLGYLFRYTKDDLRRIELVVLLTPTLLNSDSASEILRTERKRMIEHKIDISDTDLGRGFGGSVRPVDRLRAGLAAQRNGSALRAYRDGTSEDAIEMSRESLTFLPGNVKLRCNLGLFLRDAGELQQAEAVLRDVLADDPLESGARNNLAILLMDTERFDEAISVLTEGLALETDSGRMETMEGNLRLCRSLADCPSVESDPGPSGMLDLQPNEALNP